MQIVFDFPKQQITIDGEELELVELLKLVREIAPKFPAISIVSKTTEPAESTPPPASSTNGANGTPHANGAGTLRQFTRSIELDNISERIAAVAYYQKHYGSRPNLSPKEANELFTQCGFQKPAQMPVAFFDAKRKYGYMESAGHGIWRVSTQGENLIIGKMEARNESET